MVIMERSKLPELAASTSVQEQNTTDEEKSAATGLESVQWNRWEAQPGRWGTLVLMLGRAAHKPAWQVRYYSVSGMRRWAQQ